MSGLKLYPRDFPVTSDEIDSLSESYLLKYYNEIFAKYTLQTKRNFCLLKSN